MNILITICGRGGSKGVKNKNIREVAGKPLIAYTIDVAKKWGKGRVVCSTDSEEIAKVAKENGAEVPFIRPADLASDISGKVPVIRHALTECEKIYKEKYDLVVDLDVTSPIRKVKDLDNCLKIFNDKNPDVLLSVVEAHRNPYFNMVELGDDGFAKLSKEGKFLRRQDTPKVYDLNASIYFYNTKFLANPDNNSVLAGKVAIYEMDKVSGTDVDSETDLKYIEFLINNGVLE